jgi:DNA polymerase-3 subunit delta'
VISAPEPRANPLLLGHESAEATLAEAMRSGRMHHAWLITGPYGIGKATLAFRFARRLLAGVSSGATLELDEKNPVFRRVAASGHADLLTVEREWDPKRQRLRGEIIVDDVRRISDFLHLTPAEGGWRVVVVDGADELNWHAAPALLKILEEPPARAVLLLACAAPGRLPATIRSRCRRLPLAPLNEIDLMRLLSLLAPEIDEQQRGRLATLAEGSPGRALQLAEGGGVGAADLVGSVLDALPKLNPQQAIERGHAVADTLGRDEEAFSTFMDLLRAAIAAAVRDAARGHADPEQTRLTGNRPLDAWADVWQALTRLQNETETAYLDRRQAIVMSLSKMAGAP